MWFRARGRKRAAGDLEDAAPPAQAEDEDNDAAVLAAVTGIAEAPTLPQLPKLPVGGGTSPALKAAPTQGLADMWDTVGDTASAPPPAPVQARPEATGLRHSLPVPKVVEEPPAPPKIATPPATLGAALAPAPAAAPARKPAATVKTVAPVDTAALPVGFLVIVDGPGRGAHFALEAGVSQIGRGPDEDVPLTFGDSTIARHAHASVAFDAEACAFYVGHGGKKNIVRLNGKPVLSTETLTSHDVLRVGETSLMFVALCGEAFDWSQGGGRG